MGEPFVVPCSRCRGHGTLVDDGNGGEQPGNVYGIAYSYHPCPHTIKCPTCNGHGSLLARVFDVVEAKR